MNVNPPDWKKTCEAARQLRQDLVDGYIDVRTYKPRLLAQSFFFYAVSFALLHELYTKYCVRLPSGQAAWRRCTTDMGQKWKMPSSSSSNGKCTQLNKN